MPVYQRQNAIIFSTERVKMETVLPDSTTFYGWLNDNQLLENQIDVNAGYDLSYLE